MTQYQKLQQQAANQPKRREPTTRVAPKNQVAQIGGGPLDNSIASTNLSFNATKDSAKGNKSPVGNSSYLTSSNRISSASSRIQAQSTAQSQMHPSKK